MPHEKKAEFAKVFNQFFLSSDSHVMFKDELKYLSTQQRNGIFQKIGNNRGYAISSSDKFYYYPLNDLSACYRSPACTYGNCLATYKLGKKSIPTFCRDFEWIVFVEKPRFRGVFKKLYANGTLENL